MHLQLNNFTQSATLSISTFSEKVEIDKVEIDKVESTFSTFSTFSNFIKMFFECKLQLCQLNFINSMQLYQVTATLLLLNVAQQC